MSDDLVALAVELVTARNGDMPDPEYVAYVSNRLDEELDDRDDAYHLVTILATIGGDVVREWADDTGRSPQQVLQAIALDVHTQPEDPGPD